MKKIVTVIVALLLAMSLLTTAMAFEDNANTFPIVEGEYELKVLALDAYPEVIDWYTNSITKYWQELTGITVKWDIVYSNSVEKLTVTMADDDMPDVIIDGMTKDMAVSYGSQGLIIPLNDLIEDYGVNTKALFDYDPFVEPSITAPDGNIYFLPAYDNTSKQHGYHNYKCLVNQKWLNNLGMEAPTTLDEFYDMLVAFKEQDADGNGDPDNEIPLADVGTTRRFGSFLMNCFVYTDCNNKYFYVEDGEIKTSYTQDGWKEGLKFLHKLYEEELVDQEVFLATKASVKLLTGAEGGSRVGALESYSYSNVMDIGEGGPRGEYVFIEPLPNQNGEKITPTTGSSCSPIFCITKACEHPEIAFRWADAQMIDPLADDLSHLDGFYGPEGEGWRRAEEGETGLDGVTPAKYAWLFAWGEDNNINYHEYGILNRFADHKLVMVSDVEGWDQETILWKATFDIYDQYAAPETMWLPSSIMFTEDKVAEASQLLTNVINYVDESYAKFVTGVWDIDEMWDAYLNELNEYGYETMMDLYQEAYTRQYGVMFEN